MDDKKQDSNQRVYTEKELLEEGNGENAIKNAASDFVARLNAHANSVLRRSSFDAINQHATNPMIKQITSKNANAGHASVQFDNEMINTVNAGASTFAGTASVNDATAEAMLSARSNTMVANAPTVAGDASAIDAKASNVNNTSTARKNHSQRKKTTPNARGKTNAMVQSIASVPTSSSNVDSIKSSTPKMKPSKGRSDKQVSSNNKTNQSQYAFATVAGSSSNAPNDLTKVNAVVRTADNSTSLSQSITTDTNATSSSQVNVLPSAIH